MAQYLGILTLFQQNFFVVLKLVIFAHTLSFPTFNIHIKFFGLVKGEKSSVISREKYVNK